MLNNLLMEVVLSHVIIQSTHPRRMRPQFNLRYGKEEGFQSTHPRRMRQTNPRIPIELSIEFQSTHPRRMRRFDIMKIDDE